MNRLDPEDRENVIFVDPNGEIFSNKPELKNGVKKYEFIGNNTYKSDSGETVVGPGEPSEPTQPFDSNFQQGIENPDNSSIPPQVGGSGPYRRVYSNNGYSWVSAYVTLPGGTNIKDDNLGTNKDTGYVYFGGWGATNVGIDAGMQHSSTYDNWAPSTLANGTMLTDATRYKPGQDIYMEFYVTATNEATLSVSGVTTSGVSKTTAIVRSGVSGWTKDGNGVRLKRMTTIGTYNYNSSNVTLNYINAGEETVSIQANG